VDTLPHRRPQFVDNSVDPVERPPVSSFLPEGAVRNRRNRDHIKGLHSAPVASGASLSGPGGFGRPRPFDDRPTDCDRHPGVGTSVGLSSKRASAVFPLDALLEARTPVTTRPSEPTTAFDRARPIPPADQTARLDALQAAVRDRSSVVPRVGIVLGSGLGDLADDLEEATAIPFAELPGWPAATAPGHAGRLLLGRLGRTPVVMLQGRFHLYEGNDPGLVVQPVLLFRRLGAEIVVLTNAAGGVDPSYGPGTLMVISDHLNLTGRNPLIGPNAEEIGPRFGDLTDAWSPRLRAALKAAGEAEGVALVEGVYAGLLGPNYETPAEVRMLRTLGADAVGMSTVLECIAARWAGLEVCGVSLVTNAGAGYSGEPLSHEEVLAAGAEAGPRLARVIRRFVADLA
jgi:purine-nucleoside phosphorylase